MENRNNKYQNPRDLIAPLDRLGYVVDEEMATVLYLMLQLDKPLLLEGNPGVGKTEAAYLISALLNIDLIRLQCYEGLDVNNAVYEWNYQKQLLAIKIQENADLTATEKEELIFSDQYLLKRPLLQAISSSNRKVLLIDEIDRADEEFEAFLLELLSAYQISIPEMGTIRAQTPPLVLLTSNRTRELSDALKRRCLYYWVPYPNAAKELAIIQKHIPDIEIHFLENIVSAVQKIRTLDLDKNPGVAESIDWVKGLLALQKQELNPDSLKESIACLVKSSRDQQIVLENQASILA